MMLVLMTAFSSNVGFLLRKKIVGAALNSDGTLVKKVTGSGRRPT